MNFLSITLGNYYPAESPIHALDPRLKIVSMALLMAATFALSNPAAVALHSAAVICVVVLTGVPLSVYARGMRMFFFLFLFTGILHLFFTAGTPILETGGPVHLTVTREGVTRGALVSWRLLVVITFSAVLTYSTTPLSITRGLESLLTPLSRLRFPVQDFSLMMMMAIRFIPVLTDETDRVWKAQRSRGADLGRGGPRRRTATLLSVILPVFMGLFRRADELALALEARGYVPGRPRTAMVPLAWSRCDTAALVLVAVWLAAAGAWMVGKACGRWG